MKTIILILLAVVLAAGSVRAERKSDEDVLRKIKEVHWPLAYAEHDNAVIAGTGVVKGAPGPDGPHDFTYESSNVMIKRDKRWQAVLSHVSGVEPQ
jgi:hypothetical protein